MHEQPRCPCCGEPARYEIAVRKVRIGVFDGGVQVLRDVASEYECGGGHRWKLGVYAALFQAPWQATDDQPSEYLTASRPAVEGHLATWTLVLNRYGTPHASLRKKLPTLYCEASSLDFGPADLGDAERADAAVRWAEAFIAAEG